MKWWRGENCNDGPLTEQEVEILQTYEAEAERGLLHNSTWIRRMQQLESIRDDQLREEGKCPGGSISTRDPNFDEDHVFVNGICAQCRMREVEA